MSPGSVTEILYFFLARYQSRMKTSAGGGVHGEEDIEVLEVPFAKAMQMVSDGDIRDAKTIILLQHLKIHHPIFREL